MERDNECHLTLFGIPTLIIADDPHLLAAARAAHADWMANRAAATPDLVIRLARSEAPSAGVSPAIAVDGSRLTLDGDGITGWADAVAREAVCRIPAALIGDPARLADAVTDTLLLFIATRNGRPPIHASGIVIGEAAMVLAGPSGSGKSTLALAASDRGLDVLSDDTLYVAPEPLRVWGWPRPIHVLAENAPPGDHATRWRGGRAKLAIPLRTHRTLAVDKGALVVLKRGDRATLEEIDPARAVADLDAPEPGFDLLRAESRAAITALATKGAWQLTLSRDPHAAIDLLLEAFG